jgi:hypothetical protein
LRNTGRRNSGQVKEVKDTGWELGERLAGMEERMASLRSSKGSAILERVRFPLRAEGKLREHSGKTEAGFGSKLHCGLPSCAPLLSIYPLWQNICHTVSQCFPLWLSFVLSVLIVLHLPPANSVDAVGLLESNWGMCISKNFKMILPSTYF